MEPTTKQIREVEEMFGPEGNWDDYWLGNPPSTNSFLQEDQRGWVSAEQVLRGLPDDDTPNDVYLDLMRAPGKPDGGGVMGLDEEYTPIITGVMRAGERALDEERKLQRLGRNRTRR